MTSRLACICLALAALLVPAAQAPAAPKRPPVVILIFDEFLGDTLLGRDGKIDPVRYPNFASLAADGYWFPNAFSSYDSTSKGTPLILDGLKPRNHVPATRAGHPRSIYDMFGRRGYRFVNDEAATALCPRRYCPGAPREHPSVLRQLAGDRAGRFERFVAKIKPSEKPTFYLQHVLLPHVPYNYLPSGRRSRSGGGDLIRGMNSPLSFHDRFLTQHNYQRYLLQLGFLDREVGKLLTRLKRLEMYDDTLIALTADQAIALSELGTSDRRKVNDRNVDEVASVPMIIKAPGQKRGDTRKTYMRTLDFTPTIADLLDFKLGYRADGSSAFSRAVKRRRSVFLVTRDFKRIVRISARRYEARRRKNTRRRIKWFGAGSESLFTGIGPHRELLGKTVGAAKASPLNARITAPERYRDVRPPSGIVPTQVVGSIENIKGRPKRDVAVAINGRIEATGRTWYLQGSGIEHFAVNVPEASLRAGRNTVDVYEIDRDGTLVKL